MEGQWGDNNMYLTNSEFSNHGHVTAEMWAVMANGGWVEEGLLNSVNWWTSPPGPLAYQQFWADSNGSTFNFHWIHNLGHDGANHVYQIQNVGGTNHWNVYLDWRYVNVSTVLSSSTISAPQVGLEFDQGTANESPPLTPGSDADTFNAWLNTESSSGVWTYPSWSTHAPDYPCGTYPNGYCLNGVSNNTGEWSYNKPLS